MQATQRDLDMCFWHAGAPVNASAVPESRCDQFTTQNARPDNARTAKQRNASGIRAVRGRRRSKVA
eukprot:3341614-Alexandrium_andersonii.AAC.2